jgi:hypothetical protein
VEPRSRSSDGKRFGNFSIGSISERWRRRARTPVARPTKRVNTCGQFSLAWDQELIAALPNFPKPRDQRDVAGRHYLSKAEMNALYFATHRMPRPKGWNQPISVGKFWRCALVLFFNYGVDTGTIWKCTPCHSRCSGDMFRETDSHLIER